MEDEERRNNSMKLDKFKFIWLIGMAVCGVGSLVTSAATNGMMKTEIAKEVSKQLVKLTEN